MKRGTYHRVLRMVSVVGAMLLIGLVSGCESVGSGRIGRMADSETLKPGLAPLYFYHFMGKNLDALFSSKLALSFGEPGKPIPYLNYAFGKGNVFGSGENSGVGVQMEGYLHLSRPGEYGFKAYANDGIRVFVNRQVVADDPYWHEKGDRFSKPLHIQISQPGWYPILVRYFQRKGTATLIFYWKQPGEQDYSVIPAKAYGHLESQEKKK